MGLKRNEMIFLKGENVGKQLYVLDMYVWDMFVLDMYVLDNMYVLSKFSKPKKSFFSLFLSF